MKLGRVIPVDLSDQLLGSSRRAGHGQGLEHLALTHLAMLDVLADLGHTVLDHGPVTRVEAARSERQHRRERSHVLGHVSVWGIYHRRAPPQHGVAGEQGTGLRIVEHDVIAGVARRPQRSKHDPAAFDPMPTCQGPLTFLGLEGEDRRPGRAGECRCPRGVIPVMVSQQDDADRTRFLEDRSDMGVVRGSGVDHERRVVPDDPRVRPLQREGSGIGGQHAAHPGHRSRMMAE